MLFLNGTENKHEILLSCGCIICIETCIIKLLYYRDPSADYILAMILALPAEKQASILTKLGQQLAADTWLSSVHSISFSSLSLPSSLSLSLSTTSLAILYRVLSASIYTLSSFSLVFFCVQFSFSLEQVVECGQCVYTSTTTIGYRCIVMYM